MFEQIKRIAQHSAQAQMPARFFFGEVLSCAPLCVMVENRFRISGEILVQMKGLAEHKHTIASMQTDAASEHAHTLQAHETQEHIDLRVGDKVVVLRNEGGQQYLILGRL